MRRFALLAFCALLVSVATPAPLAAGVNEIRDKLEFHQIEKQKPTVAPPSTKPVRIKDIPDDGTYPAILRDPLLASGAAKADAGKPLTQEEFLVYLRAAEALNPGKRWEAVASKLHALAYPQDSDLKIMGISLFKTGERSGGFGDVLLPSSAPPKFMTNAKGELVDVAHAYAGARALADRNRVTGAVMGKINTGWGDQVQVLGDQVEGTKSILAGIFTLDKGKIRKGADTFGDAGKWRPPVQERGNRLGMAVLGVLAKNRNGRLSDAFEAALGE